MLFNSFHFLFFFPISVTAYFLTPYRYRWVPLLVASFYFYAAWKVEFLPLILASTIITYFMAIRMNAASSASVRRGYLIVSLCANLGILFIFKYFNFFNDSLQSVLSQVNVLYSMPRFELLLPLGISFYTFSLLSYSIDVYRGDMKPERHLGIFSLYVSFFPKILAGPIERASRLIPQFYEKNTFDYARMTGGLKLMLWGFFKKLVIADRLSIYVSKVYDHPADYQGLPVIMATYFFAFQIYCDFSGYSDIAVGAAQITGHKLMDNFKQPYFSRSIQEFWQRWHISLSTWLRDYLYIPLGGNRVSSPRWYFNILIVFLLCGLWHGSSWTFIVWSSLHGFYLIFSRLTGTIRARITALTSIERYPLIQKYMKVAITFHLVAFAWIFFRANTISDACLLIHNMVQIDTGNLHINVALGNYELAIAFLSIGIMECIHFIQSRQPLRNLFARQPEWIRWSLYYSAIFYVINFGMFKNPNQFIYIQF